MKVKGQTSETKKFGNFSKYRRKVLTRDIEEYLKNLIQEIAQEKGFEVSQVEVGEKDHVHIFVSAHPKIAPSYIVKMIKGITARKIFLKFPHIKNTYGRVICGILLTI